MQIAIIGGGFTGLAAAYELGKLGHQVTLFEKDKVLGGLAHGFREKDWEWSLEAAYHHLFTNDHAILSLVGELGLADKLILKRPITATLWRNKFYQLDSPMHLLRFPGLPLKSRLRTGALLAFFKLAPFWPGLETITTQDFLERWGGATSWQRLWQPLMEGKFSRYAPLVAASWFWARIKKRTPQLYYLAGGFHTLIEALENAITKYGGKIYTNTEVLNIKHQVSRKKNSLILNTKYQSVSFDRVLLTIPTPVAVKITQLPYSYTFPIMNIQHLHAQTLILETTEPILRDVYWLNITDRSFPFLAVVAHTNFIEPNHYAGHHLTYFGNYLPDGHPYLSMTKEQLLNKFLPYIKRLSQNSKFLPGRQAGEILNSKLYVGPYAQPVHGLRYSAIAPKLMTPIKHLYLANLDSIYPWDRGTNYAVELGFKAARFIDQDS